MQLLEHRRYYQSLGLLSKCMKGNGPDYISNLFELRLLRYSEHNLTQPSIIIESILSQFFSLQGFAFAHL